MVSFNTIQHSRLPWMWVEFDNSAASASVPKWKTLILGTKKQSGKADLEKPYLVSSSTAAMEMFGENSLLHRQIDAYKLNDSMNETWAYAFARTASASTASIDFLDKTGSRTASQANEQFVLNMGGKIVTIELDAADNASRKETWAQKLVEALRKNSALGVSAEVEVAENSVTVKISALSKDDSFDDMYLAVEKSPAAFDVVVSQFQSGRQEYNFSKLFAALGDEKFNCIVCPFTDAESLKALSDEMDTRWGGHTQNDGFVCLTTNAAHQNAITLSQSLNSQCLTLFSAYGIPDSTARINAAIAAQISRSAAIDPAMPLQTLPLKGINAPRIEQKTRFEECNVLLNNGISTLNCTANTVHIERALTTYKRNPSGQNDESYLSLENVLTLSYIRNDFRTYFWNKYSRYKLADDGTSFRSGQKVMTPKLAKAEAIARFNQWELDGLVQNASDFTKQLIVERNAQNRSRLDFLLPPTIMNQLVQVATQIQFRI